MQWTDVGPLGLVRRLTKLDAGVADLFADLGVRRVGRIGNERSISSGRRRIGSLGSDGERGRVAETGGCRGRVVKAVLDVSGRGRDRLPNQFGEGAGQTSRHRETSGSGCYEHEREQLHGGWSVGELADTRSRRKRSPCSSLSGAVK